MKRFFFSLFLFFIAGSFVSAYSSELDKALALLNEGKTDEAIFAIAEKIKREPETSDNYMLMGLACIDREDYSGAENNFKEALKINKKIVAAHYMLAMIYEREGKFEFAVRKWNRIIQYSKDENLKKLAQKHIRQLEGGNNH